MPEEPDGLSFMLHADPLWPHYSRKGREAHLLAVLLGKRTDHIDTLLNKINKNLGVIRKLSSILPCSILYTLYNTLICPYFSYCR